MDRTSESPSSVEPLDPALWSALVDGELSEAEWQAIAKPGHWPCRQGNPGRLQQLQGYHLIGDVLRLQTAQPGLSEQTAFLQKLQQRLPEAALPVADQIAAVQAVNQPVTVQAANEPVFRWRAWAGLAAVASVAAVLVLGPGREEQASLAQAPQAMPTPAAPAMPAVATRQAMAELPMMLRDPQLDQWLAAHRQAGGNSALQMPAGFLRNATFEPGR